jgi:hypothetical protein
MTRAIASSLFYLVMVPLVALFCVALLAIFLFLIQAFLPLLACQHYRRVRWLMPVSVAYYPTVGALLVLVCGVPWWLVLPWLVPLAFYAPFLPDPYTYFTQPRTRAAILRAIESQEANVACQLDYHSVRVVGTEAGLTLVLLRLSDHEGHGRIQYFAVGKDGAVEPLSLAEQRRRFGYDPDEEEEVRD